MGPCVITLLANLPLIIIKVLIWLMSMIRMIIIDWMMAGTWVFGLVEYVNTLDFYTF